MAKRDTDKKPWWAQDFRDENGFKDYEAEHQSIVDAKARFWKELEESSPDHLKKEIEYLKNPVKNENVKTVHLTGGPTDFFVSEFNRCQDYLNEIESELKLMKSDPLVDQVKYLEDKLDYYLENLPNHVKMASGVVLANKTIGSDRLGIDRIILEKINRIKSKVDYKYKSRVDEADNQTQQVINRLNDYQFDSFLKSNGYDVEQVHNLIGERRGKIVAHLTAILCHVGFWDHLLKEYANGTKSKAFDLLAKVIDASSRAVKGNINIIVNTKSTEDPSNYTSGLILQEIKEKIDKTKIRK